MKKCVAISLLTFAIHSAMAATPGSQSPSPTNKETPETQYLKSVSTTLTEKITQVADNVYVASGYDASNIAMIIGTDGYVLIDAGKFPSNSQKVHDEFKKITDKPLKAIIFTHGHNDHVGGTEPFLAGTKGVKLYAAENLGVEDEFDQLAGHKNQRAYMQAGMKLPPSERINNGVALPVYKDGAFSDKPVAKGEKSPYTPAITKDDITNPITAPVSTIEVAGLTLELIRAAGESEDTLMVYYPAKDVMFVGDLIYRSFPNLYSIRGTKYRDVRAWIDALNVIVDKNPNAVVMGHTRPFVGKKETQQAVTNYRDAVAFVFEKSIEGMNNGLTPDELVEYVQLPEHLAKDPNLAPLYGNPDWAVRGIFNGYLGWFDGNPTSLDPLPPKEEAAKYIAMMGGAEKVTDAAVHAIQQGEYRWALQLCDKLLAVDGNNQNTKNIKAEALLLLSDRTLNAPTRNYYKTYAFELQKGQR